MTASGRAERRRPRREVTAIVRAGAVALVLAWIGNALVTTGARGVGIGEGLMALSYPSVLFLTAVGVVGATVVYAVLDRLTGRPDRNFVVLAAVVLVLSVVPDFTSIPDEPGGSLPAGIVLASMHVLTAVIVVWQLVDWTALRR